MGPRPYSERSSLPNDTNTTDNISADLVPPQLLAESPSPPTLSAASTPSPISQDIIPVEYAADYITVQEEGTGIDTSAIPCYPAPGDTMPYDHALPDFIVIISRFIVIHFCKNVAMIKLGILEADNESTKFTKFTFLEFASHFENDKSSEDVNVYA